MVGSTGHTPLSRVHALALAVLLAFALVLTLAQQSAHASFFTFCTGANLNSTSMPGDRCVHSVARQYQYVRVGVSFATSKCAIVKQLSTGGGNNNTAPGCGYGTSDVYSYCGSPYSCNGYPTITNDGVATGWQYYGAANF